MNIHEKRQFIPTPVPVPLLEAARSLRKNMTDAEQLIWKNLRRKQLGGFRFRRQHPVERFVLDFYCCEAKLGVELDGGQHNEPEARLRDHERTTFLQESGIQVIRFWNSEVLENTDGVLETIYSSLQRALHQPAPPPPNLPPLGGGVRSAPRSRLSPRWGRSLKQPSKFPPPAPSPTLPRRGPVVERRRWGRRPMQG